MNVERARRTILGDAAQEPQRQQRHSDQEAETI